MAQAKEQEILLPSGSLSAPFFFAVIQNVLTELGSNHQTTQFVSTFFASVSSTTLAVTLTLSPSTSLQHLLN